MTITIDNDNSHHHHVGVIKVFKMLCKVKLKYSDVTSMICVVSYTNSQ